MGVAKQNYQIEQGQTFAVQLTIQTAGIAIPCTASTTINSATVTVTSATGLAVGQSLTGTGLQSNTIISNISGTTLTVTLPATATGTGIACLAGSLVAVNLTGNTFLFSAQEYPIGSNPSSLIIQNWTEATTPLLGQTWFILPYSTTAQMIPWVPSYPSVPYPQQQQGYQYQIWMFVTGTSSLTPVQEGMMSITQSVSTRTS